MHILRLNCAETIQDRPGQPACEMFCIKRRFQQCKFWPARFKESSVRMHQIWVPPSKRAVSATVGQSSKRTVADRHRLAAHHNKHCWRGFQCTNIDDLERKISVLGDFFTILRCDAHLEWIFGFLKYTGDRLRQPAYEIKLMLSHVPWALAQISCSDRLDILPIVHFLTSLCFSNSDCCIPCLENVVTAYRHGLMNNDIAMHLRPSIVCTRI